MILLATLLFIPLHNSKLPLIKNTLHDEPRDGFLVLGVHAAGFDELVFQLADAFGVGFGGHVHDEGVYHLDS